ncbi:hypothetical protein FKM82_019713 [Ascaphus truei]
MHQIPRRRSRIGRARCLHLPCMKRPPVPPAYPIPYCEGLGEGSQVSRKKAASVRLFLPAKVSQNSWPR